MKRAFRADLTESEDEKKTANSGVGRPAQPRRALADFPHRMLAGDSTTSLTERKES